MAAILDDKGQIFILIHTTKRRI